MDTVIQFRGKELDLSLVKALNLGEARHGIRYLGIRLEQITPDNPEHAQFADLCAELKAHADSLNVVIDKPEAWPEASAMTGVAYVETMSGGLDEFPIKAVPHHEFERVQDTYPDPETPEWSTLSTEKTLQEKAFRKGKAEAEMKRLVSYIDYGWTKIPGDTIEAKVAWVNENLWRDSEVLALFSSIADLSGIGKGRKTETQIKAEKIADPIAWAARSQSISNFAFEFESCSHTFQLVAVSRVKAQQIDAATKEPEAPEKASKMKGGRPSGSYIDYKDPKYRADCLEQRKKRLCMYLEASLFPIPGKDLAEKMAWVSKRPSGEVEGLLFHIMNEINSYRSRVDFS